MKKEKKVRTYQRRTKSGKMVTVKAHTAKYDAAEHAKELAKKKGAGEELEERKKKRPAQLIPFDKEEEEKVLQAPELSGEKLAKGVAFKNNKLGMAWAKKNGEPIKSLGQTYYKVGDDLYGNITAGHGGTVCGKLDKSSAKSIISYHKEEAHAKDWKKNPVVPDSPAGRTKLYKLLTDKNTKRWELPLKYQAFFGSNGKLGPKGRAFVKDYESERTPKSAVTNTTTKPTTSGPAFTAAEFKEWYQGTGSAADKKVAKALRAQLGRSGYKKLEDEAIDNYSARGHLSMFKRVSSDGGKSPSKTTPKAKSTLVRVGADPKRVEEVKKQRVEEDKRDKAFLALPKPEKGSKGYATHMALRSYVKQGGFGDDSMRDALVRHGYPKETAYSKGIAEVIALGRKHGVIPEHKYKSSKQKANTKKSYTTAKRMKPSEVADMTTKRDWVYSD